jgi:adenylosuccinate lyase
VGQLAGAVGVLGFFDSRGTALRAEFCRELGLYDPGISWTSSRDRLAEFAGLLAMVSTTLARIGNEVYELQRPEIAELREPSTLASVGSITMPHKRNPEASEHLDTLARLARSNASILVEGMVSGHERDGRAWKAEWVALPEVCLLTGVALATARRLVGGLHVDTQAMRADLERSADWASEQVLAHLSERLGKHAAQQQLHELLAPGAASRPQLVAAVAASGLATAEECRAWVSEPSTGGAETMVDTVLARAQARRADETDEWVASAWS